MLCHTDRGVNVKRNIFSSHIKGERESKIMLHSKPLGLELQCLRKVKDDLS